MAEELDYVPLPPAVEDAIRQHWGRFTDLGGTRVVLD
jgi:hypothetical protein